MGKKDFAFIIGLTIIVSVIWIIVEGLMIWLGVKGIVCLVWRITVIATTCVISVWHGFKKDSAKKSKKKRKKK